jgi:hypothetical protein
MFSLIGGLLALRLRDRLLMRRASMLNQTLAFRDQEA